MVREHQTRNLEIPGSRYARPGMTNAEGKRKMGDRLKGKRAVVTAAAAGIGRACAIAFAREGATVIATDIDEKGIASLTKEGIAETARLDVRSTADVDAFAKRLGKIDVLLNAAGFVHHGTILECSEQDWDFSFDLTVMSMHRTI
jgi:2-keto-3-deoxy-L-fuconate dehydrogenase